MFARSNIEQLIDDLRALRLEPQNKAKALDTGKTKTPLNKFIDRFVTLFSSKIIFDKNNKQQFEFKIIDGIWEQLANCKITENDIKKFETVLNTAEAKARLCEFNMNASIGQAFSAVLKSFIKAESTARHYTC